MDWTTVTVAGMGFVSAFATAAWGYAAGRRERRDQEAREDERRVGPFLALTMETIELTDPDRIIELANDNRSLAMREVGALHERLAAALRDIRELHLMHPRAAVREQAGKTQETLAFFLNPLGGATIIGPWFDEVDSYGEFRALIRQRRLEALDGVRALAATVRRDER